MSGKGKRPVVAGNRGKGTEEETEEGTERWDTGKEDTEGRLAAVLLLPPLCPS